MHGYEDIRLTFWFFFWENVIKWTPFQCFTHNCISTLEIDIVVTCYCTVMHLGLFRPDNVSYEWQKSDPSWLSKAVWSGGL